MSEQTVETVVWGYVRVGDNDYMLLDERPAHSAVWQKDGTTRWLVADVDVYDVVGTDIIHTPIYLVFGTNAVLEWFPNPKRTIMVNKYIPDFEDVEGNPV